MKSESDENLETRVDAGHDAEVEHPAANPIRPLLRTASCPVRIQALPPPPRNGGFTHETHSSPDKWTQNAYARNKDGVTICATVPYDDFEQEPASCCLYGAVHWCYPQKDRSRIRDKIRQHISDASILAWNDLPTRTFDDVKSLVEALDI